MFRHAVSIAAYSRLGAPCDFCPISLISPLKSAAVKAGSIPPFDLTSRALASSLLTMIVKSFTDSIPALDMFGPLVESIPHDESSKLNTEDALLIRESRWVDSHLEALRAVEPKCALAVKLFSPTKSFDATLHKLGQDASKGEPASYGMRPCLACTSNSTHLGRICL